MGVSERRSRERQRRRADILRAAAEVFAERGLEGASMDAIAARAELGKATLYYYFPNKQALFEAVLTSRIKHFLNFDEALAGDPARADLATEVRRLLLAYLDFFRENEGLLSLMLPYVARINLGAPPAAAALPPTLMVPQQAYLARFDELLEHTPWAERRHEFMAFLTDVVICLCHLWIDGRHDEARRRIDFVVDLVRGRLAWSEPFGAPAPEEAPAATG